jgi:hypothetical protein
LQVVAISNTSKPSVSMPNIALHLCHAQCSLPTILSSGVNSQGAHDMNYLQCGPIVNVELQAG